MSNPLKPKSQDCDVGDFLLVRANDKIFSLKLKQPETETERKHLVFAQKLRRNIDGLVAAV
jgi:hypothetical protein